MQAPFPWFGGKSRAAPLIWARLGDVVNYVEPFFGSGAVLLGRPDPPGIETVNDADGFVSNFWRAVQHDPEAVARWADNPINENDLHARHSYLAGLRHEFVPRLEGDPDFYDAQIAGWWCWGLCCWIAGGWCSGKGPWHVKDGRLVKREGDAGMGVKRQRVHLGDAGRGVNRQLVHLNRGRGVNRQLVPLVEWMQALADRFRRVRVCCGDWSRVCGPTPTVKMGLTGIVLDPPYSEGERDMGCYAVDDGTVAARVREWALEHGHDPRLRIALCGYDTEHVMPGWEAVPWVASGGYSSRAKDGDNGNKYREVVWFSPHCLRPESAQMGLFAKGRP